MLTTKEYNQLIISMSLIEPLTLDSAKKILRAFTDFGDQPESFELDSKMVVTRSARTPNQGESVKGSPAKRQFDRETISGVTGIDYANFYRKYGNKIKELAEMQFEELPAPELQQIKKELADCMLKERDVRPGGCWGDEVWLVQEILIGLRRHAMQGVEAIQ